MSIGLNELLNYVRSEGRVCPVPTEWNRLWETLPSRGRTADGRSVLPVPLILAAWHEASDDQKSERLRVHILWAAEHGALGAAAKLLLGLSPDQWHWRQGR